MMSVDRGLTREQGRRLYNWLTSEPVGDGDCPSCAIGHLAEVCEIGGFNLLERCEVCNRVFAGGDPIELWGVDHEFISPSDYQAGALKTANNVNGVPALTNWALGLTGEAGEVADIVKKHAFHGKSLDKTHLAEEVGDVLWYVAMLCNWLGVDMGEVMAANLEKLQDRYPNGFSKAGE